MMRVNISARDLAGLFLLCFCGSQIAIAAEKLHSAPNPFSVIPTTNLEDVLDAKKGGGTPSPPADPHCQYGSVGPITHQTINKPCKVDGKDGTKVCYTKFVACLSGPGDAESAYTENCGACMIVAGTDAGEFDSLSGN